MINFAVVDDEYDECAKMYEYISKYCDNNAIAYNICTFKNGEDFLAALSDKFNIVFMDIQLDGDSNGYETAIRLRKKDSEMVIVFVTNLARFAIKGYEVSAIDFIVKPLSYDTFVLKMNRILSKLKLNEGDITINARGKVINLPFSKIEYIETEGHLAVYHTKDGVYKTYSSLKTVERQINSPLFFKCNNCYLVNLKYVKSVDGFDLRIGNETLQVSRARKTDLIKALNLYWGGGLA